MVTIEHQEQYELQECYKGYAIEIRESIPGSFPETWTVRLHAHTWYYDFANTFATKALALECAKDRIDKWKEADEKDEK